MELLDRQDERSALDQLLAQARTGSSGVLVVRGDPGIGKSVLLNHLLSRSEGWCVATAAGVESELELAYSGLHQLCGPLLDHLERLPEAQRRALAVVFGLDEGPAPDLFMVGLATLTLLAEVSEHQPLLCVIDDAHWLDPASAQVLAFVGRRLLAERVALVFALRTATGHPALRDLPELLVPGLADEVGLMPLLDGLLGPLDVAVCHQIVEECRGNPLALLELPRGMTAADLAGGFGFPAAHPLASSIEQSYARRVSAMPEDTRLLVLTAAASPLGDTSLLHRAAGFLGLRIEAADAATSAGLLDIGGRVAFAHPLVRSAAYRSALPQQRRAAHLALAQATDSTVDPDRQAWHLAMAAAGPDEEVAAGLERSAARAQARSGLAGAAAFLTRATELTPDPRVRVDRALDAALANVQAGGFDTAQTMLTVTDQAGSLTPMQHARLDMLRAQLAFASRRGAEATPLLLSAAAHLERVDIGLARETYVDAFSAALFGARLNVEVTVADVARAARAAPRPATDQPRVADELLEALVCLTEDYASAIGPCQHVLRRLTGPDATAAERLRWLWQGCVIALEIWDDAAADSLSGRSVGAGRGSGTLSELALALSARAPVLVFCGDFSAAAQAVAECAVVSKATGVESAPYGAIMLAAWRGAAREAEELISLTAQEVATRGEGIGIAICDYARAVLCNSLGDYDQAFKAASSACQAQEMVVENWALCELIEAAVRTGQLEAARAASDRLTYKAEATGAPWGMGLRSRGRALVQDGGAAEEAFRDALELLSGTSVRVELGRTHLLFGEWLRRQGRRLDAREQLRHADTIFTSTGAHAFAERTRRELVATGEKVHKRTVEDQARLTPQEEQIARLAVDGHTNSEIAVMFFLSARTVEWHLRKVFAKLDVSSRRELREALSHYSGGAVTA